MQLGLSKWKYLKISPWFWLNQQGGIVNWECIACHVIQCIIVLFILKWHRAVTVSWTLNTFFLYVVLFGYNMFSLCWALFFWSVCIPDNYDRCSFKEKYIKMFLRRNTAYCCIIFSAALLHHAEGNTIHRSKCNCRLITK